MGDGFLGIVCGLKSEAEALGKLARHPGIRVFVSGADADRARAGAEKLIAEGAKGLLSFGVSGGLSGIAMPGDLIAVTAVDCSAGRYESEPNWCDAWSGFALFQDETLHFGAAYGSDEIVGTVEDKQKLARSTRALAVDMESHAVAEVAVKHGLPFIGLRSIADPADQVIPPSAAHGISEDGAVRPFAVLAAAVFRPGDLSHLIKVGRYSARAHKTLRSGAGHLVPALLGIMNLD